MLNRYIIIAIIVILLLGVGGYFYVNSQRSTSSTGPGHMMECDLGDLGTVVNVHKFGNDLR